MKKSEAKKLLFDELKPFFSNCGFKLVTTKFSGFIRETSEYRDWVFIDCKDYNPIQNIQYYISKRITLIQDIFDKVDEVFLISNRENIVFANTLKFTYEWLNGKFGSMGYLPDIRTEDDVKENARLITEFMQTTALPLLDRFNDIREIDKEINGEDFWKDDWRKPFMLGAFVFNRLIIAHLCSNRNFETIYKFHEEKFQESRSDDPAFPLILVDNKNSLQYLREILTKIKPLY